MTAVATRVEGIDAHALWRLYGQGASQLWRAAERGESRLACGAALTMSGEPHVDMNVGIVDAGPRAEEHLRRFAAVLRERGLPGYLVLTAAVADELAPTAHDLRLAPRGTTALMVRGPAHTPRAGGEFAAGRLDDPAEAAALAGVLAAAWAVPGELMDRALGPAALSAPGVDLFLARDTATGAPVSAAVSTVTGGAVGVWAVSTVPRQRGRGAARAVLAALLRHHRGAPGPFYLTAASVRPLYEAFGFETAAEGVVWDVPA